MNAPAAWKDALQAACGELARFDEPMKNRVAFRIGGPAEAYVEPTSDTMLAEVLRIARSADLSVLVLGTGANVLVSDEGIEGITIRLRGELADVHIALGAGLKAAEIEVGAGALNAQLVAMTLRLGLVGLEFLATIPGTFGGALIMNAGAHGAEIESCVREVRLLDGDLQKVVRRRDECGFSYRSSGFAKNEILTSAVIDLSHGDIQEAKLRLQKMRGARKKTQPIKEPNAGSIFKNPDGDYAGRLIEACGLKGKALGGAKISEVHANFIVNHDNATANDVVELADLARSRVFEAHGIDLEWEVKRIGRWKERRVHS